MYLVPRSLLSQLPKTLGTRLITASRSNEEMLQFALINRAGGLYGRILTEQGREHKPKMRGEVCTHDRGQDSPIQTD